MDVAELLSSFSAGFVCGLARGVVASCAVMTLHRRRPPLPRKLQMATAIVKHVVTLLLLCLVGGGCGLGLVKFIGVDSLL